MRILLAEDERALSRAIVKLLEKSNFSVDAVYDGVEALQYLDCAGYDAAIFDIMMPRLDGISAVKRLRAAGNKIPVLVLTAKAELDDRVLGLDSGADYYLTKPFEGAELVAALRAITRKGAQADTKIRFGNVWLDRASFTLGTQSGSFRLTNKEFQMMEMLISQPRRVISAEHFLEQIWGIDSEAEISSVWVYVSYLRKKLTALLADIEIKSSRNLGYFLEEKK